jgi:ABC-2 type transport system permease protein
MTDASAVRQFARLRWRLLRNILRTDGSQKWAILLGLVSAVVAGVAAAILLLTAGRALDNPEPVFVLSAAAVTMLVVAIGVVTGISQPVDPRVLATAPLSDRQLGLGLLAASAVGPPGLAALLFGIGLFAGAVRGPPSVVPIALAVVALLLTLLLISRSTINLLGLMATRFPRVGQLVVGLASLIFYGGLQVVSRVAPSLGDEDRRQALADVAVWTPPGQLGRAIGVADESIGSALVHLVAGSAWLIGLAWAYVWTTQRLLVSTKRSSMTGGSADAAATIRPLRAAIRRLCGQGPIGAAAWRSLLTRVRTPRTVLETFTGAGVGLAIVLVPTLLRDQPGGGAVLVGGAVQFAVLFIAGNSFGADGPALASELLAGVDPRVIVRAKARSVAIVAIPIALVGPLIAATVTGEWAYLPAGLLVGFGGLFAGTGGAIVQSTLVPIAIPESDNPLASGDSGKGCLAGLMFAVVLLSMAVVTLPVAVSLLWAVDQDSVPLSTTFAVATLAAGGAVYEFGMRYATTRWRRNEPEIYDAVVPAQ